VKTLVAGWFSFEAMGATAGDLLARDLVCEWLEEAGRPYDVAVAPPFEPALDWREVDPADYGELVFVCGPLGNGWPVDELFRRFESRRLIGVNLSMIEPLDTWNPFDVLLERDSSQAARPDVGFLSSAPAVPVVGVVLVHPQREYEHGRHAEAETAIERLLAGRELARVHIDTRLDVNETGLRSPAEVESLIARMDVVVTTRLHGLVLALKNGVPALAIDPIAGGAKIRRQAETLGWPAAFTPEGLDDAALADALDWCLRSEAREEARRCRERAVAAVHETRAAFIAGL
jgi:hypothetical protein